MFPYLCRTYKEVIRESIAQSRERGTPRTFQAMADHCHIQKTYLSRVINHDAHLSDDQLYLALDYLDLSDEAREFTFLLSALEKTTIQNRREQFEEKLKKIRSKKLKTEEHLNIKAESLQTENLTEYFLEPYLQIVHVGLATKRFSQAPLKLAEALGLSSQVLNHYLSSLEGLGLIKIHGPRSKPSKVEVLRPHLHLPRDSFLQNSYAARLRLKALERIEKLSEDDANQFSVIFSSNQKTREQIRASFMEWLKKTQATVQASRDEDVYQMNFDLFNWT